MNERMVILLKNAAKCFDQMYSPFCHEELTKMNVSADECKDLSVNISNIISEHIAEETMPHGIPSYIVSLMKSQKQVEKTRTIVQAFEMDYVEMPEAVMKVAIGKSEKLRQDMLFLLNFVRLDWLRQISGQDCSEKATEQ